MNVDAFEGYVGIHFGNGQLIQDILFVLIIILLSFFALVFRIHYPIFVKMVHGFISTKERQSFFDTSMNKGLFFNFFMKFQALFLCSIFFYLAYYSYTEIKNQSIYTSFILIAVFFCITCVFYFLKQCLYFLYGHVFSENGKYRLWVSNYQTLFYIWGILLYLPVLWLLFDSVHLQYIFILFIFIYILFRIAVVYIKIRIFYNKNTGLLYLSSYLCAQEIIPLLFLYESLNYLHNIIESSFLWQ